MNIIARTIAATHANIIESIISFFEVPRSFYSKSETFMAAAIDIKKTIPFIKPGIICD